MEPSTREPKTLTRLYSLSCRNELHANWGGILHENIIPLPGVAETTDEALGFIHCPASILMRAARKKDGFALEAILDLLQKLRDVAVFVRRSASGRLSQDAA